MKGYRIPTIILGAVMAMLLLIPNTQVVMAQSCETESFTISPHGPYNHGTSLELNGISNCPSVRFEVDGITHPHSNDGELRETLQTITMNPGWHQACFAAYGTSGWSQFDRSCKNFFVRTNMNLANVIYSVCPPVVSRIDIGQDISVSDADLQPLNLRTQPGLNHATIANIPVNTQLTVLNGPVCASNWRWWQTSYNGLTGWFGEIGPQNLYNVVPVGCPTSFVNLAIGNTAQITPGDANHLRSGAGLDFLHIGWARNGTDFIIIGGPICNDGYRWWLVNYNEGEVIGWVAEGNQFTSWMELH
jgi:uncharacterized protein YraI